MTSIHAETLIAIQERLERDCKEASEALKGYKRSETGMTLESEKTPQWFANKAEYQNCHTALRNFNRRYVKVINNWKKAAA